MTAATEETAAAEEEAAEAEEAAEEEAAEADGTLAAHWLRRFLLRSHTWGWIL